MRSTGKGWVVRIGVFAAAVLAAAEPPADPPKDAQAKVEELRKRFPFESLVGRLDYEPAGAEAFAKSDPPPRVTDETLKRLADAEKTTAGVARFNPRLRSLQLLHSEQAQKFVERDGFGQGRMVPQDSPAFLELPVGPTIPFAAVREAPAGSQEARRTPKEADLAAFHQNSLYDFLSPYGFGYVKDREHVAGFQPHQFRTMPELPTAAPKTPTGEVEKWAVIRLELVSLLKHEQPVVYITHALPRMEDVSDAAVRPLIPFEEKGLKALKNGDDLATETSGDRIRMVGSLRASKQCLECHQVKRGDLLGAFTWELQRQMVKDDVVP